MKSILRWLAGLGAYYARTLDLPLLGALCALMVFDLFVMYSAGGNQGAHFALKQGMNFVAGLGFMWALSRVPPARLRSWTPAAYVAALLPLLLVLFIGHGKHGNLWIDLHFFYLQPSELVKITLPMALAWWFNREPLPPGIKTLLVAGLLIAVPVGLVLLQPDFGTALLIIAGGVFALYLAGLAWQWFALGGFGAIAGYGVAMYAPIEWFFFFREYQKERILTFRNPENDPLGAGWNIVQSKIAIGGGGFTGKGWLHGTQAHLNYLPEHTTDFAFSVLSEEFGWIGVAFAMVLYVFIIGRCLWIAIDARDTYSRIIAGTLGLSMFVYVVFNGGMISGLLPVVGVPMPLLSYGGTAAVSLLAGMGIVMAVKAHRPVHGY